MIDVVEYKPEHLDFIVLRPDQVHERPERVMTYALTFKFMDKPVAIFGYFFLVPGIMHFWGLVSEGVRECPLAFHKACLTYLSYYQEKFNPRRMQMDVRLGFQEGIAWAESLGFQREGIMRKFGPDGSDYYLYGRVA